MTLTAWFFAVAIGVLGLAVVMIIIRGNGSRTWLANQFEWAKGFFEETAGQANKPSHKNLVVLAAMWVFLVAFLKVVVATAAKEIPDIPANWLTFFVAALGIRAVQSVFETRVRNNGGGDSPPTP